MSQVDRFLTGFCWSSAGFGAAYIVMCADLGSRSGALLAAAAALINLVLLACIERAQARQATLRAERDQWLEQYVQLLEKQAHLR